ncbi:MAG TPA: MOSC N-terminal beta barrel domain-containing protein [Gaiellaceae bacterium]|nr:MOSC N-terminal beta barrel domain-containing protein [Gaiellaceae bacterium]
MITVSRISIAPVKSLGLVFPDEVQLGAHGIAGDRRFWMTDATGRLYNNKRLGTFVLVRPTWDEESGQLTLAFPNGSAVSGTVELGTETATTFYGAAFPSRRVIGPWEDALSEYAGEPLLLFHAPDGATDRGLHGGTVSLVSEASLARLGEVAGAAAPLDGRRFRMLFEIDGVEAHEEDEWIGRRIRIGEAEIVFRGDIGRCVVTSHDPDTGETDVDTLRALATYRREGRSEPLPLGIYGQVVEPGRVRIGDTVTIAATRVFAASST